MQSSPDNKSPAGNLQPSLYAALIITLTLAVTAVSLRFLSRRLVRAPLWLDDWLTLVALVTTIGFNINVLFLTKNGTGQHIQNINRDTALVYHDFFLGLWIAELFYTFALAPAKLAFLAFYWRIFKSSSITLPIKITASAVICWAIVIVTICHCIPVQGFWDKSIAATCRVDDQKFFVGSVTPHLLMDLVILALPVPYIRSLRISWRQKLCIFAMFLLGGFLCFATIIQVVVCFKLDTKSKDVTWTFAPIALWATVEVNLAVMAACLPSLRPVYRLVLTGSPKSMQSSEQRTHYSNTLSGKSKFQALVMLKNAYSESTNQLAGAECESGKSFREGFVDGSSQRSGTTCEVDSIALRQMHAAKDVIMVREEVNVRISESENSHPQLK